jgi:hypothetical protein
MPTGRDMQNQFVVKQISSFTHKNVLYQKHMLNSLNPNVNYMHQVIFCLLNQINKIKKCLEVKIDKNHAGMCTTTFGPHKCQ